MTARRLLPTLLLVLLLTVAGCGGDDSESGSESGSGDDPTKLYADAVRELDSLKSGAIDAQLDTLLRLNDQTINVSEKGVFADGGGTTLPKFDIEIDVEQTGGEPQSTSAVHTGDDFYVRANGEQKYEAQGAEAAEALSSTYEREQGELGAGRIPLLSLTPSDWAKSPKLEGTETFDGVSVQRVVADVDVPAFLKDLETGKESDIGMGVTLTEDARELLEPGADVKAARLVALIGEEDGRLRRLTANVDGDVGGGVKVDFDVQLTGLDEPQEISAP